jgi:kynureninase
MKPTQSTASDLDRADPLRHFRAQFHVPRDSQGNELVYLCGHSLGLQPHSTAQVINEELDTWARLGVDGHFHSVRPWLSYHEQVTPQLARLVGAKSDEVVAMNSLTVNLHLMLASFYQPTATRFRILIEERAFSSDRYAAASHLKLHGVSQADALIEIPARNSDYTLPTETVLESIERFGPSTAVVLLPGVQFLSGQRLDLAQITEAAHRHGCFVGFDLAHAIGNVPLELHDWNVDFAVWCSYKYLNSGPGSIGGCFVHQRHGRDPNRLRLAGWWGHQKNTRFDMPQQFEPIAGAEGWQISNPPIFALAPLLASLRMFEEAGFKALRDKSLRLTAYLHDLLNSTSDGRVQILTPSDPNERGCQLSLRLNESPARAKAIHTALTQRGFVCDWREPDVVRVAPVPFYNTFTEVLRFAEALRQVV